jgi:hypothetical protein
VWYDAKPNRNKRSKWFISKAEYPDDVWPPYVTGGSALISFDYANRIVEGFKTTKPLFIDDVYLGIKHGTFFIDIFLQEWRIT